MSTQRYISTSFWDDEWIHKLDPSEKLLYLYFMTNPLTNIAGVYKLSNSRISYDTGFNDNTIGHIMEKFEKAGKAYRIGEYIALPSWPKHQKWETRSKIEAGMVACLLELPESCLVRLVQIGYKYDLLDVFDTLSISYPYDTNYSDIDSDSDTDIDSEAKPPKTEPMPRKKPAFIPPTIEQVETYILEKQLCIDPSKFMDWYSKTDWKDNQGNQIKNWKNKLISWDAREREKNPAAVPYSKPKPQEPHRPKTCPKCGSHMTGLSCPSCYANFDSEGNEV